MVDNSMAVSGFCITGAMLAVLLKKYCKEQSMLTALGVCVVILGVVLTMISQLLQKTEDLFIQAGVNENYIILIYKAMAICFITQITSDICKDSGESAIASVAEFWGRASILIIALPLIEALLDMVTSIL